MDEFPRKLKEIERELLFSILPAGKPGYKMYRDKLSDRYVIGIGRFGETNLVLGSKDDKFSIQDASSTIFAAGSIIYDTGKIEISINEEIDDRIEFDISPREYEQLVKEKEIKRWNYSEWVPGMKSPRESSIVREILIVPDKYVLAISQVEKRIWVYGFETGINYLIPLSNFYNQLMIYKNIRDPKIALKPNLFFEKVQSEYTDIELRNTFIIYNKYLRKLSIKEELMITNPPKSKRKLFGIFKRNE